MGNLNDEIKKGEKVGFDNKPLVELKEKGKAMVAVFKGQREIVTKDGKEKYTLGLFELVETTGDTTAKGGDEVEMFLSGQLRWALGKIELGKKVGIIYEGRVKVSGIKQTVHQYDVRELA